MLAKSNGQGLIEHNQALLKSAEYFQNSFSHLPEYAECPEFWELLHLAIILHDLGKTAAGFQKLLKYAIRYAFRHEWLSGSIVLDLNIPHAQKQLILNAVLSHHKSFRELKRRFINCEATKKMLNEGDEINLEVDRIFEHEIETLDYNWIKQYLKQFEIYMPIFSHRNPLPDALEPWLKKNKKISEREKWQNIFFSAALSICDHNASAGLTDILQLQRRHFNFLDRFNPRAYQQVAWEHSGNALLVAPTGTGKTEAALGWLNNQLQQRKGRAFYVLPFTASINAMVKRISKNFDDETYVGILHGKAKFFIDEYYESQEGCSLQDMVEMHKKIYKPFKVLTPFQILKWAFGVKGFEKGLTELAGSYLIFDEIHVYDRKLYQNLLFFVEWLIEKLHVKVFIMTATLPMFIQEQLKNRFSITEAIRPDSSYLDSIIRHKISLQDGLIEDQISFVCEQLKIGKKVLLVCNTVTKAQKLFSQFQTNEELKTFEKIMLHSRFNTRDRLRIEKLILAENKPALLIGTQAIEVSLDIDYDLIVTEPAPLDALLQRFGRVYRKRIFSENSEANCIVTKTIEDVFKIIYSEEDVIENTLLVLSEYNQEVIKESDVQKMLDRVYAPYEIDNWERDIFFEMLDDLYPFDVYEENEEKFNSQFDGVEVLPANLEAEFNDLIESHRYLEAEKLLVPISQNKYWMYRQNNYVSSIKKYKHIPKIDIDYTDRIGLIEPFAFN